MSTCRNSNSDDVFSDARNMSGVTVVIRKEIKSFISILVFCSCKNKEQHSSLFSVLDGF